jgi:hypothetical protein
MKRQIIRFKQSFDNTSTGSDSTKPDSANMKQTFLIYSTR